MPNPKDYAVGWICAITTEYVAAQEFLDEEHEGPDYVSPNDDNHYTLGRLGRHNVVVAVLPDNEYGKSSAAGVARSMMHSFPNVRIGLMVGIGGGAPGKHDIRLGDVVVSSAANSGGVLGYDFGKDIQGQDFQVTGFLNQPPTVLRTAMSGLKARYERKGHQLSETVDMILEKNKRLQKKYKQPDITMDQLFKPEATHDSVCAEHCRYDASNLVSRPDRAEDEDTPVIHYGLIASADKLMKNALDRDRISEEHDVLCFEMEAAGLMNSFPCLIIRGICDYSDSHKSKSWQGYAAMVAAAYAKDLLCQIPPNRLEAERTVSDILSGLHEAIQDHRDIAQQQLRADKERERHECHQLFRLTTASRDATYEWYKDRVQERVEGTCMWFLKHDYFQTWLNQESGPLLVSADPGCGKSVLAKYLIDHVLPRSAITCYFFFKDQDQNTMRQVLCALLHQLFSLNPALIEHAMPQFRKNGHGLINSTESLWEILRNSIKDPQTGSVIVVLDALDECAETEFADLMRNVEEQFYRNQAGYGKLRYLLTCRPYNRILSEFGALLDIFPEIHIPGEEDSETISQEVNHVIRCRVSQLAMKKRFTAQIKNHLEKRLQEATHRTYLWVYLVFDYLQKEDFKKTVKGIELTIAKLPTSVNEAYEQILNKTNEDPIVRKILCIILAANRPLTVSEMNVAVNIDETVDSVHDLDLENDEDFKERLRSWCGLFVSIHHGNIYFLHQTAREFLLADLGSSTAIASGLRWHHSITNSQAHDVLLNVCLLYLNLFNSSVPPDTNPEASQYVDTDSLLYYSAQYWVSHFRKADIIDDATVVSFIRRVCDTSSRGFSVWFNIYRYGNSMVPLGNRTSLIIASYIGLPVLVKLLLKEGAETEARDSLHSMTPLSWAVWEGHKAVIKLLLEQGVNVNTTNDDFEKTSLYVAAEQGHEAVVELLLESGAKVNTKSTYNRQTPLHIATLKGNIAIMKLLLKNGADIEEKDHHAFTPLLAAIHQENETTIKFLLEKGADMDCINAYSILPGHDVYYDHDYIDKNAILNLLVVNGAFLEHETINWRYSPLTWAVTHGDEADVRHLLNNGATVGSRDKEGHTALDRAYVRGHDGIINLLIRRGALFDSSPYHPMCH